MRRADEDDYRDYVLPRLDRWRRTAYLLCRDWHAADDLVSITLARLYRSWGRAREATSLYGYVRGWLDEHRRSWRREDSTAHPPDLVTLDPHRTVTDRIELTKLLTVLPPRQRAVVVLRFYCDMSVAETAELLGVSEGTVKSQSARGLEILRSCWNEENV